MGNYFKVYVTLLVVTLFLILSQLKCKDKVKENANDQDTIKSSYILRALNNENINDINNNNKKNDNIDAVKSSTNSDENVLCVIMTSEKTFMKRSVTTWNSWAKKCHKALFACNCANITKILSSDREIYKNALEVPIWQLNLTENYDNMAEKVFHIVRSMFDTYGETYNWFMLTDDDTYVFVEHMHKFIKTISPTAPHTYGYNYKTIVPTGYHSGGGGVLFTKESIKRIHANIVKGVCDEKKGYGDVALGNCAYKSNITMGNSLDSTGKERFHPLDFVAHYRGYIPDWLHKYSSNGVKTGFDCCSDETITFHYTSDEQMDFFANMKNQTLFKNIYKVY